MSQFLICKFLVLHKFQKTVKKLLGLLTVHPMASASNIFELSLGEELFDQVMISHRNVIAVSPSNEECGTLQYSRFSNLILKCHMYLILRPIRIREHRYGFQECLVNCVKVDPPSNFSVFIYV